MNQIEKFEKLCTQIFFHKGTFNFPFDGIQHNGEFESIVKFQEQVFVLNILGKAQKIQLKGQFIYHEASDLLYFWGTPLIRSEKDFENTGLHIKDFSIFDWNVSFLQVNNFCGKIGAKLYLANMLDITWVGVVFQNFKNFIDLTYDLQIDKNHIQFIDVGSDNIHPGPLQHQQYSEKLYNFIKEKNHGQTI